MKKILFSLIALLISVCSFAAGYSVKIEGTVQPGSTSVVSIMVKNEAILKVLDLAFNLPEGFTATGITSCCDLDASHNTVGNEYRVVMSKVGSTLAANNDYVAVAKITVTVPESTVLGTTTATTIKEVLALEDNTAAPVTVPETGTITVQRATPIEPQTGDYSFSITPFKTEANKTYVSGTDNSIEVPVILKNAEYVSAASFTLTLPSGFSIASYKSGMKTTTKQPVVNTVRSYNDVECESTSALSFTQAKAEQVVTYTLGSTGDGDFVEAGDDEIAKVYLTSDNNVTNGIYTFKIESVSITSTPDGENFTEHKGADYYFSVMVGQTPSTTPDPIAYGNYTSEALSELVTATPDVRTLDLTQATVKDASGNEMTEQDVSAKFNDIMVYGKTKTCYTRNVKDAQKWGSICVPYDLTSDEKVKYYTLASADASSVTLTGVTNLPANTPAFFQVTTAGTKITASADGYKFPTTAGSGDEKSNLQMVGTYENTTVDDGDYYISGNKLYSDGATLRPFKAYLKDMSSGAKAAILDVFIEGATGVEKVAAYNTETGEIYDLSGRKLNEAKKGINIINGKKVLK